MRKNQNSILHSMVMVASEPDLVFSSSVQRMFHFTGGTKNFAQFKHIINVQFKFFLVGFYFCQKDPGKK